MNSLDLDILQHTVDTKFASVTRLLESTEWNTVVEAAILVDPNGSCVERTRDSRCLLDIVGEDGSGEAILGVIRQLEGFLLGAKLADGYDGAEDLSSAFVS